MDIRQATRADNDALSALEARTPLNIGDTPLYIKRTNFFETHDLQERLVVMVAEEAGEVIGVCAGALHRAPLGGVERLLQYTHHERIAPEHQRRGVGGELARAVSDYWKENAGGHIDSSYWYIASGNQQSRNFAERNGARPWPVSGHMCVLEAAASSGEKPRRIGAGPTFDIVRLINATHQGEDLFRPYEHVDFGQRLSRSVSYGWGDIYGRLRDGRLVAVAGLWNAGVADYGFEPGAEDEMVALLRSLTGLVAGSGREGLTLFLDPRSALYAALNGLPQSMLELLFYAPRIEPTPDGRPIHMDPVYF